MSQRSTSDGATSDGSVRGIVAALILAVVAGLLAAVSLVAPATIDYAHISSADAPPSGGPLVLAGESPRILSVRVDGVGGAGANAALLTTMGDLAAASGLTIRPGQDLTLGISAPGPLGTERVELQAQGLPLVVTYTSTGAAGAVTVQSPSGTETIETGRIGMDGIFTSPDAQVAWDLDTAATSSSPSTVALVAWALAVLALLAVAALAVSRLPRVRAAGRPRGLVLVGVAAFWVGAGLLMRANFDDGWILAQARLYSDYGWFSMYWENASLPAPTGYLWEWGLNLASSLAQYQYAFTRIVVTCVSWFFGWLLVDWSLRIQGASGNSRIVAFGAFAAVGAGIGMNVRPEAFTAMLAAVVLYCASLPASERGWRAVTVSLMSGIAIGSHPAGWVAALPAAAVVLHDVRAARSLGVRLLILAGSGAAALATLAVMVSVDMPAAVSLPAVDFLSAGPLQGRSPFDEFVRVSDLVGFPPSFRMGMAMCLLAVAFLLGWLLKPSGSAGGFLAGCAALSMAGLLLTSSKWAAHTAALTPAVAITAGLVWPDLSRTPKRLAGVAAALVFVVAWTFAGDVSLGDSYQGNVSGLPGDQLFTTPRTALVAAVALTGLGLLAVLGLIKAAMRGGAVAAGLAAWFMLIPIVAVASASGVEVARSEGSWSLTGQHLAPGDDCGAAAEMPILRTTSGALPDPLSISIDSQAPDTELEMPVPTGADVVAVWTDAADDGHVGLELITGAAEAVPFVRNEPFGANRALWTAMLPAGQEGVTVRVTSSEGREVRMSAPTPGTVGPWAQHAQGEAVLAAPYSSLQIPCVTPLPLPLDTVTQPAPLVWVGDVRQSPSWWLPRRIAVASEVFALSAGPGPVGLNLATVRPTALAQLAEPRTCQTQWGSLTLESCADHLSP